MNIYIGITDKEDRGGKQGRDGRGAIYYSGRYGKVYENGREVGFHYVNHELGDGQEDYHVEDHKVAFFSIDNCGFRVKDIVTTEVDMVRGSIKWLVNGKAIALFCSDYIKYM